MRSSISTSSQLRKAGTHLLRFALTGIILCTIIAFASGPSLNLEQTFIAASPTYAGYTWRRIPDFEKWLTEQSIKPRLLIIGPSSTYRGIIPYMIDSTFNINSFNAGSTIQTLTSSAVLLERALSRTKIKWVLLDINAAIWDQAGTQEDKLDLMVNNPDIRSYSGLVSWREPRLIGTYLYYTYKRGLFSLLNKQESITRLNNDSYVAKGFVCSIPNKPSEFTHTIKHPVLTSQVKDQIARIQAMCSHAGVQLIFIFPKVQGLDTDFAPQQYGNIINTNRMDLDSSYFYDDVHLRCEGTRLYTQYIINELPSRDTTGLLHL